MRASSVSWQQRAMLLTSGTRVSGLAWWTTAALVAVSVAQLALFGLTALLRLGYPYPLEPSEPASLAEVQRILMGPPLYVEPSLGYVPLVYGPIYFCLSAAVAALLGPTFLPLRLVSLIASVGCLALVYAIVRRETASRVAALASAALLAAANPLIETALDIGRVDSLFTLLILLGAYLVRGATLPSKQHTRRQLAVLGVAGICFGLAAVTKSPLAAVPSMGAVLVFLAVYERVRASAFAVGAVAAAGLVLVVLRLQSGPWPTWYLLDLPRQHAVAALLIGRFWLTDVLPRFSVPLVIGPLFLAARARCADKRATIFFGLLLPALLVTSWASRSNGGGAENVLLPAVAALAILFGFGITALSRQLQAASPRSALWTYALVLGVVELCLLAYNPRLVVPLGADAQADTRLASGLATLAGSNGPVFAPDFAGYLPVADRLGQPLLAAVDELQGGYGGAATAEGRQWNADLKQALAERRYRYVVLQRVECCLEDVVRSAGYEYAGSPFADNDPFYSWRTPRTPDPKVYVAPTS
jgi:4-amino-4-deoxy-L-arabinose transferase-like glycosyltransferase